MNKNKWMKLYEGIDLVVRGVVDKLETDDFKCYRCGDIVRTDIKAPAPKNRYKLVEKEPDEGITYDDIFKEVMKAKSFPWTIKDYRPCEKHNMAITIWFSNGIQRSFQLQEDYSIVDVTGKKVKR